MGRKKKNYKIPYEYLKIGDKGTPVRQIQDILIKFKYLSKASGRFEEDTKRALQEFQCDNHIPVTGIYDIHTYIKFKEVFK